MPQPTHSDEQRYIFAPKTRPADERNWLIGERWLDLYALLEIAPDSPTRDVDEAIIDRVADCLCANFSRRVSSARLDTILAHQAEARLILLSPTIRRRYDALLARHRAGDADAPNYATFCRESEPPHSPELAGCRNSLLTLPLVLPFLLLRAWWDAGH